MADSTPKGKYLVVTLPENNIKNSMTALTGFMDSESEAVKGIPDALRKQVSVVRIVDTVHEIWDKHFKKVKEEDEAPLSKLMGEKPNPAPFVKKKSKTDKGD